MSAKEIKGHLKAAKLALDKQDFKTTLGHCQDIFRADEKHYTGLVFAGLSSLKLSEYEEARGYYRRAVVVQPDGPLAWKGFADFYDHRKPVVKEEQLEAIDVYTKLLSFVENDAEKLCSTYQKLVGLHKEFNHQDEVIRYYEAATLTCNPDDLLSSDAAAASSHSELWTDFSAYLFSREKIPEDCWAKLHKGFPRIQESDEKQVLRTKLVKRLYSRYLASSVYDADLRVFLEEECVNLVETAPLTALPIFLHLLLAETLPSSLQELKERPVTVSEQQRQWVCLLSSAAAESGAGPEERGSVGVATPQGSLGWAGQALVSMADGKWSEARDAMSRSVGSVKCECWCWSCLLHLYLHNYKVAEKAAENGLACLSGAAKFRVSKLECNLKLWRCEAYIGSENTKLVSQTLPFLTEQVKEARESHVTAVLVKAYLLLGDISSAQSVLESVGDEAKDAVLLALQGEVYLAQQDYTKALSRLEAGLLVHPNSPALLFTKAKVLWVDTEQDKARAYSVLLQVAKADPMNPEVFLYLGHYQRLVNGDLKRAEKCYQKAVSLQPSHPEAAIALGDILWMNGEKEKVYDVYRAVTTAALPSRTKVAWIRMGLYQKAAKQYNEAIKSFQTILSSFPEDKHCWECLGEVYLARGSHNSALRTFTKCLELDPDSMQCHYQIASIKQLLGSLQESLGDYSSVLERDPNFVPALKGKGEAYLKLAHVALQQNFDGKAVGLVSLAIENLTQAAWLRPKFVCVWKLLGDCCTCLYQVPPSVARPCVPSILRRGEHEVTSVLELETVEKKELLEIGCRCYTKGIEVQPEAAHLWHDLSLGYFYLANCLESDVAEERQALETSLKVSKKAVSLQPNSHRHWNTLGVIAACGRGISDPALAQHSFIRSIQEEKNNAVAWTNLGALYLKHYNTELAYEAFKTAQSLSPDYTQAWIGHALIAERVGSAEAMDLYRHCTELEYHPEASNGYGYWVCQSLGTVSPHWLLIPGRVGLTEPANRVVVQARDNLQKLWCREMADACALNNLGLLWEQEGLLTEARRAFTRALESFKKDSDSNVLAVNFNLARVQSILGPAGEATDSLMSVCQEENKNKSVWLELALALSRQNKFADSHKAYEQAALLSQKGSESGQDSNISAILTAQAMVAYTCGDKDACMTLLFQAFESVPVSLHCLVSLCALGCLDNNLTLLSATLQELEKVIDWQPESAFLLHHSCARVLHVIKLLLTATADAETTGVWGDISKILRKLPEPSQPFTPSPTPSVLHSMLTGKDRNTVRSQAQKLIHSTPDNVWALAVMTSQLEQSEIRDAYKTKTRLLVESELEALSVSGNVSPWHRSGERSLAALKNWLLNA